jgi:hypothetical protein
LHDLIEDIAILTHGPPQPVLLARDGDHDLIKMLDVVAAWCLTLQAGSISSISQTLKGKQKYNQTTWAMIWDGNRCRL